MIHYPYQPIWRTAVDFLWSGHPPVIIRLLAVNALFVLVYAIRRAIQAEPMGSVMMFAAQMTFVLANLFVLFQSNIEIYVRSMMQ